MKRQVCAIGAGSGLKGSIKITKGKVTDAGTLEVTGRKSQRRESEDGIKRISKKKVVFKQPSLERCF